MITNDKEWIQNFLVPHLVKGGKLMKDCSEAESLEILDLRLKYLSVKDSFMLTTCYKVDITFQCCGKKHSNTFIVKKTPDITEDAYEAVNFDTLFHNEITAYTEIMPTLGCYDNYPKYFYSHRKKLEAVLVLGDFSIDGWRMTKSRVNLSLEHILLSVQNLGRFHGCGFASKQKNPEKFHELVSSLKEPRYARNPPSQWALILGNCTKRAIQAARERSSAPAHFLDELAKLIPDAFDYGKKKVQPVEPLATICHGDYLRNNLAFKYDNEENPIDVMMFDFQTFRYASPLLDLSTLLCLSAGKDVRSKYLNTIFESYYENLISTYTEKVGSDTKCIPEFLSADNVLEELIRCYPYGIVIASSFLMILHEPDNMEPSEILNEVKTDEEVLQDLLTRGGDVVNEEFAALIQELYNLTEKYKVDIFKIP